MLDDVSSTSCLNPLMSILNDPSPPLSSKRLSTTPTSTPPRKKSSPPALTAAQPTKTTRASTKTSSLIPTPTWPKSTTRHTRAVGATRKWRMRMTGKAARMRERRSLRRRRLKRRIDGWAGRIKTLKNREGIMHAFIAEALVRRL